MSSVDPMMFLLLAERFTALGLSLYEAAQGAGATEQDVLDSIAKADAADAKWADVLKEKFGIGD